MVDSELASRVRSSLAVDADAFDERAADEAAFILEAVDNGVFDNPQGLVGLEYEFYAIEHRGGSGSWVAPDQAGEMGALARVPRRLLEYVGFEKELGLHNAELSTMPQPLNHHGLRAQEREVMGRLQAAQEAMRTHGLQLVSDGIWAIPPTGETAGEYLDDSVTVDGIRFATNMSESPRYHAMSNATPRPSMGFSVPHATFESSTIFPESLITSIQPHYQVPNARDLPTYFRYALRIAGPVLALAANAPLLPPDLYDADADPADIIEAGHDEHRIAIFEQVMNSASVEKVRFPRDIDTISEALDAIVADLTLVPAELDTDGDRFDDQFAHLRHKHGSYWRWVRPVFDGDSRSAANARVEFRPLPAQPTIRDTIGLTTLFIGLMVGLRRESHPVWDLSWETARDNFYAAAKDGLDADLRWVTREAERTDDFETVFEELFQVAVRGLETKGLPRREIDRYLDPLRRRVDHRMTPAEWKRTRARNRLQAGSSLEQAIYSAKQQYFERQLEAAADSTFADWIEKTSV